MVGFPQRVEKLAQSQLSPCQYGNNFDLNIYKRKVPCHCRIGEQLKKIKGTSGEIANDGWITHFQG